MIVVAWDCQFPVRATAVLSLSDRSLHSNSVQLTGPMVPGTILLRVPSNSNSNDGEYALTVVGEVGAGLEVFRERRELEFRPQFLTVIISTNKVIFNAEHPIRMRVVMLTTEGLCCCCCCY